MSFLFIELTEGTIWFLSSSILRIIYGVEILFVSTKLLFVIISSVLFGLLHCLTGWNTYTFLQTGAIGFAFAVIFVKSGNILIPMILHFLYDVIANMAWYVEWNHTPAFDNLYSIFTIMLGVMFIISSIILIVPERKK